MDFAFAYSAIAFDISQMHTYIFTCLNWNFDVTAFNLVVACSIFNLSLPVVICVVDRHQLVGFFRS